MLEQRLQLDLLDFSYSLLYRLPKSLFAKRLYYPDITYHSDYFKN